MKKYILVISFLFIGSINGFTCSCFPAGYNFCETMANDHTVATVAMVQKIADYHYGMKVRLIQLISGEPMADTVTVWGDNGALCRLYTGGWNDGDTIVMALHHTDLGGNIIYNSQYPPDLEDSSDYHISGCGAYTLNVNNGLVNGYININSMQFMTISSFLAESCIYVLNNEDPENILPVGIYPNPVTNRLYFSVPQNLNKMTNISIINAQGQEVFRQTLSLSDPLDIGHLHTGPYTILLWNDTGRKSLLLIKSE